MYSLALQFLYVIFITINEFVLTLQHFAMKFTPFHSIMSHNIVQKK